MMLDLRWAALYYPYADFRDTNFILRAALYYDELYFLQPGFFKPPGNWIENETSIWPEVDNTLKPLHEREILREVDPDLLGISDGWMPGFAPQVKDAENRAILIANIRADVENEKLQAFSAQSQKLAWSFPNSQFIGIAAAGLLFDVSKNVGHNIGIEYVTDHPKAAERFFDYSNLISVLSPKKVESRISPSSWNRESILVPFHVGEALMINIALLAATRLSAVPLTDNLLHQQFLNHKLENLISQSQLREWLHDHRIVRHTRTLQLAREAIQVVLPDVKPLTAEKVIKIRSKCSDELKRFRIEMAKLATELETRPWESEFNEEVSDIVDGKIRPAITDLEKELKKLQRELVIKVVEKIVGAAPLSLVATLFTGLPIEVALAAGVGVSALSQVFDYWHQKKITKSNGLAYLLALSR